MPAVSDPNALGNITLFHDLSPEQLSTVNDLLHARAFPAGANIVTTDQPGEVVYIISSGTVKIHVEQADGSDVILAILGAGEVVGEMSVLDSFGRSATAITMEESSLFWMDRATFWECLETMPTITYNLVRILSRRLRLANSQIQSLATLDVYGRIARQILAFAQEYGEPVAGGGVRIPIRLTQSDFADLAGASRVRVNQVLVDYKQHKYISVDHDFRITVHDAEGLAGRIK